MSNPSRQILSALDPKEVGRLCEVAPRTIREAKKSGIPASWFRIIKTLCARNGIDCPDEAFNFKRADIPEPPKKGRAVA